MTVTRPAPRVPFAPLFPGVAALVSTALWLCACGDGVGQPIRAAALASTSGGASAGGAGGGGSSGGGVPGGSYCEGVATWPDSDVSAEQELFTALDTLRAFGFRCDGSGFGASGFGGAGGLGSGNPGGGVGGIGSPGGTNGGPTLSALATSPELTCSARHHSRDMSEGADFSEITRDGETPETRMRLAGYSASVTLELIARDQAQSYLVLQQLFQQQGGACEKFLDPRLVAMGVGKFGSYWTIDLAGARSP